MQSCYNQLASTIVAFLTNTITIGTYDNIFPGQQIKISMSISRARYLEEAYCEQNYVIQKKSYFDIGLLFRLG